QRRADISFGLEVPYRNLLFFRAGHREEDWTLGMGLKLGCTMFDLGFQDKKPGSQTVLSTTWSFGGLTGLKKLGGWLKGLTAPPPEAKHRLETPTGAPSPDRLPLPAGEFVTMPSELVTESPADLLARAKLAFLSGDLFEAERLCREIGNSDNEEIKGYVSNLLEQIEQVKLINDVKKLSVTR
ncbi:MAG: hypothetical protein QGH40_04825, partial [bacterium]|nr:hypothetical protein [bacterium]